MADSTIAAIDKFFDALDGVVDRVDHVLNRTKNTEDQHHARHAKKRTPAVIDTAPTVKAAKAASSSSSTSTALATRRFRIVESTAPETGVMIFVVTNGTVRAECTTRELAEKILRGLETAL